MSTVLDKTKPAREKTARIAKSAAAKRITLSIPGLACIVLISWGVALIFLPAGLIAAGVLCGLVDHNIS